MKLQRISDLQHEISFLSSTENLELYRQRFLEGDLGKIHSAIPWEQLVKKFGLNESKKGPHCIFSPQGKIALMFLKHHAGCSDRRLLEQLNSNMYPPHQPHIDLKPVFL